MKKLKLYFIQSEYIDYLRKYDNRVAYNKVPNRPYIGVVYTYNGFNYFAPLSSPKKKHIAMNANMIDIFKIKDGELGIVNINNMIPCVMEVLTEAIPNITDKRYKALLENQLSYINSKRDILLKKVKNFQSRYRNGFLQDNIMKRCCNFELLEEKALEYEIK